MRLELSPESRVFVELRATGLLKAVGHDPVLVAHPEPTVIDVGESLADVSFEASFPAERIEVPSELGASDRDKMRENMLGRDVLEASRNPRIVLRARYTGTLGAGRLAGELVVRGAARRLAMDLTVASEGRAFLVTGAWEGRLTDLGIKPFRALLGALRLEDWIRLRVEARLSPA